MTLVVSHPLRDRFRVAAVTGTDGKTTTTTLLDAMLRATGEPTLRITTLGAFLSGELIAQASQSAGFDRALGIALERGVRTIALETTSHALSDGFASRFPPDVAVLTSFSRDHLDHHKSAEHYLASKAQLFLQLRREGTAILPLGLPASEMVLELLDERTDVKRRRFSVTSEEGELWARRVTLGEDGLEVELTGPSIASALGTVTLPMRSTVHASNLLGALLAAEALDVPLEAMRAGLASFEGVPGRMEVVWQAPMVVVDFAHTPAALAGTLRSARALAEPRGGRSVLVFGCGGDRDRGKRPEMGRVASSLADVVWLTSDNPRSEDPAAIADAVDAGRGEAIEWSRELDRETAIDRAIAAAGPRDVVVIAGRGHETTQEIAGQRRPCSDLDASLAACQRHHPHAAHRSH